MKRTLLLSAALAAIIVAPGVAAAEETNVNPTNEQLAVDTTASGDVDAGKLIGEEIYDANGDKVGEVDSVMVDPKGKVSRVVIDVSGWLESEKLVALPWKELKTDADGKVISSLTKEAATEAETYAYKDPALRKQVLTEEGERYEATTADATDADEAGDEAGEAGTAVTNADEAGDEAGDDGSALTNADGSLNASKLIGLDVRSADDDKVGDIGEVVLDKGGKVEGLVVDVGGFLGIATHPVLLNWKDVTLSDQDGKAAAIVNVTKDRLEQMPAYESSSN